MSPTTTTLAAARTAPHAAHALRALVRAGLRTNRRAPLVWGGALGVMSAFEVALYPSIRTTLSKAITSYPSGVKDAFGITSLGTIDAYLHAEMFSLVLPFALAYFAMRSVAAAIAGAEESGVLDGLLAAPVGRRTVIAGAFCTTALLLAGIVLVDGALTAITGILVGEPLGAAHLGAGLAGVWALALCFAGCATLATGLAHRATVVLGAVGGALGAMYLFDLVGKLSDAASDLRWLSAFRYYGTPLQSGLDVGGFAVLLVAAGLLAAAGAWCFERRDVT